MTRTCARNLAILARILTDHNELLNVFGNHAEPDVLRSVIVVKRVSIEFDIWSY